jgi:hypothetical protein
VCSIHAVRKEVNWSDEPVDKLELVSRTFADALSRKRIDATLCESDPDIDTAFCFTLKVRGGDSDEANTGNSI